jgi:hypothetical protein
LSRRFTSASARRSSSAPSLLFVKLPPKRTTGISSEKK